MFCGMCGQANPDDLRYCTSCGAELAKQRTPGRAGTPPRPAPAPASASASAPGGGDPGTGVIISPPGAESASPAQDTAVQPSPARAGARPSPGLVSPAGAPAEGGAAGGDVPVACNLSAGTVLADRYEVGRRLGQGGMGAVYAVFDRLRRREVALKVMLPALVADPRAAERFCNEAEIALTLAHPGIVRVFDVGEDRARRLRFYTMELLDGVSLRHWLTERRKRGEVVPPAEALDITRQILEALEYAHEATVHRDLKPENVMLCGAPGSPSAFPAGRSARGLGGGAPEDEDGARRRTKLLDFGIAKLLSGSGLTGTSVALGTASYMAPEQLLDAANVDARADVYAVGVMLYEMLTGRLPIGRYQAPSEDLPGLPPALDRPILRALAREPEGRPASARALERELEEAVQAAGLPVAGPDGGGATPASGRAETPGRAPGGSAGERPSLASVPTPVTQPPRSAAAAAAATPASYAQTLPFGMKATPAPGTAVATPPGEMAGGPPTTATPLPSPAPPAAGEKPAGRRRVRWAMWLARPKVGCTVAVTMTTVLVLAVPILYLGASKGSLRDRRPDKGRGGEVASSPPTPIVGEVPPGGPALDLVAAAGRAARRIVKIDPESAGGSRLRDRILKQEIGDTLEKGAPEDLDRLAVAIERLKDITVAERAYVIRSIGWTLHTGGRDAEAIDLYEHALALEPGAATTWYYKAVAHEGESEWTEAAAAYVRALEREPKPRYAHDLVRLLEQPDAGVEMGKEGSWRLRNDAKDLSALLEAGDPAGAKAALDKLSKALPRDDGR